MPDGKLEKVRKYSEQKIGIGPKTRGKEKQEQTRKHMENNLEYTRKSTERKNWNRSENTWKGKIGIGPKTRGKEKLEQVRKPVEGKNWNRFENPQKGKIGIGPKTHGKEKLE